MSVNRIALGKRISFYRLKFSMTQEKLADLTNCSREYIAYLENGVKTPSLPILVDLANALHISVDALLVDSLDYSLSSSDSDLHADFFVCITVIAFGIPFDFIKPHRHRRYLLDCRRKQRIVFDAGRQFVHFQRWNRFPIGL